MGIDKGPHTDPDDDGWPDDGWLDHHDESDEGYWLADDDALWADAELDGRVRQRLATLVPLRHEAFDRWDEMQPRMTRARRRRHATRALATSVLVAAIAAVGVQGADRFMPDDSSVVQAADGGDMATSDSQPPMMGVGEATSTLENPSATASDGTTGMPGPEGADNGAPPDSGIAADTPLPDETSLPPTGAPGSVAGSSVPVNGGSAASSISIPAPTTSSPTTVAPANSPTLKTTTTTRPSTSTTRAATTTTRATSATSTTTVTVRDISVIDVTVRGSEIRLVAVHNNPGVTSQVHNSGPEKLEITFLQGKDKHNLVATVHNGNVVTSIVDSDDD
ncbi:MAG: hypothetical protein R2761_03215 [Acidimicrobiales bacterium]